MDLRKFKLDVSAFSSMTCMWAPEVRVDRATGQIRMDRETGQPTYSVGVSARYAGEKEAGVMDVQVVGEPVGLVEGQSVKVYDLVMRKYTLDSGREGWSFLASAITPLTVAAPSSPEAPAAGKGASRSAAA